MGRHPHTTCFAAFPKIWVLHLLWLFRAELWELNAQLTLPPDPMEPLRFREWPPPIFRHRVPRYFQQALRKGHDPSDAGYLEPGSTEKFNLFLRVARHVPTSEDWLMRPLWPYCQRELPSVAYSAALVDALTARMGLRRLGGAATRFAMLTVPRLTRAREAACLRAMAEHPEPIHLALLVALYHERKWHFPEAPETNELYQLCHLARDRFVGSDQFTWCEEARLHRAEIDHAFWSILLAIRDHGHRSLPPPKAGITADRPFGAARDVLRWFPTRHFIVCEATAGFDDAELRAGLGYGIPMSWFTRGGRPTAYSSSVLPTERESRAALGGLLAATDLDEARFFHYRRDPSVLAELPQPAATLRNLALTGAGS